MTSENIPSINPGFTVGDKIILAKRPPYFKTAEPMPMLRPPDLISVGTVGEVEQVAPGGYYVVRFPQGRFLINPEDLDVATGPSR